MSGASRLAELIKTSDPVFKTEDILEYCTTEAAKMATTGPGMGITIAIVAVIIICCCIVCCCSSSGVYYWNKQQNVSQEAK